MCLCLLNFCRSSFFFIIKYQYSHPLVHLSPRHWWQSLQARYENFLVYSFSPHPSPPLGACKVKIIRSLNVIIWVSYAVLKKLTIKRKTEVNYQINDIRGGWRVGNCWANLKLRVFKRLEIKHRQHALGPSHGRHVQEKWNSTRVDDPPLPRCNQRALKGP